MCRKLPIILVSCAALLCLEVAGAEQSSCPVQNEPILSIENDYRNGLLTLDEKVLLQITAIKSRDDLPSRYRPLTLSTDRAGLRAATHALVDIRVNWEQLSDDTKRAVTLALSRRPTDSTFISPSGFFKLHYDLTGDHAVPADDSDFSGIPDFVEKCASYCDTAYEKHIELGYMTPPPDGGLGGDDRFDIHFEDMIYYGYAVPEGYGPMPWDDAYSYLVLHCNFVGFPPNNDPEGDIAGAAKATVAHEYHHCVQFAYDYTEGTWFMELDAVFIEDIVFDQVDDNYNYLDNFFESPHTSLMHDFGIHMYGCFVWGCFLAERFDTSLMVSVWDAARYSTVFDGLSDTLEANYGWTQDSAFAEFAVWNYCTSTRDDGQHYEEGPNYPLAAVGRTHDHFPVDLQNSPASVAGYAACYVTFVPEDTLGRLRVTFNGSDSREWAAVLVKSTSENVHEFEKLSLSQGDFSGTADVMDFADYTSVTLVSINLSEFTDGALFTYSAEVIPPHGVASQVLTLDSVVYSGGSRNYEYRVINTSDLIDVINVIAWDDLGWITPDTVPRGLYGGDSTTVAIPVHPPQGTALGTVSTLHFKAQSCGDTSVADTQTAVSMTVLQRGDVNFSGEIDMNDILYYVEYFFNLGPVPIPTEEAADFDCTLSINIADLLAIVEYSFNYGPPCPCNPY